MDAPRFDHLTRIVSHALTRRRLANACGVVASGAFGFAEAKRKKQKQELKRNFFGCVNVGGKCQGKGANCCSGICEGKKPKQGKKDKSRCVAHNVGDCPVGANSCLQVVPCGTNGLCAQTTGQASFCGGGVGICSACTKDADCEALGFGAGAACAVCIGCPQTGNTLCMSAAV